MKRTKITRWAAVVALCGTVMFSSCIGSFKLTTNLHKWNSHVGGKFVNELVFLAFCIAPVYESTVLVDVLVLNSVEFWSGKNPLASAPSTTVQGENGEYVVERSSTGYKITDTESKAVVELKFNESDQSWSAVSNGNEVKILSFTDGNQVTMYMPDGTSMNVELNQAGVIAFRQYVDAATPMFASF